MLRRCTGQDVNLIINDPPWDPQLPPKAQILGPPRPCDCGNIFDDVDYSVIYPHPPIGGRGLIELLSSTRTSTATRARAAATVRPARRTATLAVRRSPLAARRAAKTLADRRLSLGPRLQLYIEWRDLWVGAYIARDAVYLVLLPTVVLRWRRR